MTTIDNIIPPSESFTRSRSLHNVWARATNRIAIIACYCCAILTITILFLIFGYVLYRGLEGLGFTFPFHSAWKPWTWIHFESERFIGFFTILPGKSPDVIGGMRNAIAGTIILIAMASIVGIPVGMLCG